MHRQTALTGAYVFTDYKAQGQILEYVIVDLAKPPSGCLTLFSVYITSSRSRGRDQAAETTHPLEALAEEDLQLEEKVLNTKKLYPMGADT
jgi:hypothetical protein